MSGSWQPFHRTRDGRFRVALGPEDREVLKALPEQLKAALVAHPGGEVFKRLHPPAYAQDEQAEAEYRDLVGPSLDESRAHALDTLVQTAEATELSEEQMDCWARALNDIRLWLGTVLDISEDDDYENIEDPPHMLYQVLTYLQGSVIEALMEA